MTIIARFCILLSMAAIVAVGCASDPDPVFSGPPGSGDLVWDPERGIVREGKGASTDETALYGKLRETLEGKRYQECIDLSIQLTESFPDGSHAADAMIARLGARLELGRSDSGSFSTSLLLEQWLFLYLAPDHDPRILAALSSDQSAATTVTELRNTKVMEFVKMLKPDAIALENSGQLKHMYRDIVTLSTYYLPVMDIDRYRIRTAELARHLAWLAYAVEDHNLVLDIADEVAALTPPPAVKGDILFVEGLALMGNKAYAMAALTFGHLFSGANLADSDTRWRGHALYYRVRSTMSTAKGPDYDLGVYENAKDYLSEYELYLAENPGMSKGLKEAFREMIGELYGVFIRRALLAADTYDRLGEDRARDYYLERAKEHEAARDKRLLDVAEMR